MAVHRPAEHAAKYTMPATWSMLVDYVGGTNPIYIGRSPQGIATSLAGWQIQKITYDGNNNPLTVTWGGGNDAFDQIWDNRATSVVYS